MERHGYAKRGKKCATYQCWCDMKKRCQNPAATGYENYGGRGIKVCERWQSFENFLVDMGECPPGMMLERQHNDKGYYKDNCTWATRKEQNRNKRPYKNSTSGVTGVARNRTKGYEYWTAWGSVDGRTVRLYHGKDFNEAVHARKDWELNLQNITSGEEE
jgi:hypothetical protein